VARTKRARRPRGTRPEAQGTRASAGPARAPAEAEVRELEALTATHWFDSGDAGEPYTATVRFRGTRIGGGRRPAAHDSFVKDETVDGVVPGSGPVSVTTRVFGIEPGEWTVVAELVDRPGRARPARASGAGGRGATLPRAAWSWRRWSLSSGPFEPISTRWAPLARLTSPPAVIPGTWFGLVALGVAVGVALQAMLLAGEGVPVTDTLLVTLAALLGGLAAAKVRYIMLHPRGWRSSFAEGWAVGGFLVAMPLIALAGVVLLGLPIGRFLDAGAPALFVGVAIGRIGCFLTGCCAGRCTRSRWGVWSSDRRVGARRIPTQLLESLAGLVLAVLTLVAYLYLRPPVDGLIFAAGLAAYFAARWRLLQLRAERQRPAAEARAVPRAAAARH